MQYLCMRLVSTRSSPLHAAIGSAIATISSFFVVSRACITAALILHESEPFVPKCFLQPWELKSSKQARALQSSKEQAKALKSSMEANEATEATDGGNKPSRNRPAVVRDMS